MHVHHAALSGTHRFIGSTGVELRPQDTFDLVMGTNCCYLKITICGTDIPQGRGPTTHSRFQRNGEEYKEQKKTKLLITRLSLLPTWCWLPCRARTCMCKKLITSLRWLSICYCHCSCLAEQYCIYLADGRAQHDDINHF